MWPTDPTNSGLKASLSSFRCRHEKKSELREHPQYEYKIQFAYYTILIKGVAKKPPFGNFETSDYISTKKIIDFNLYS